MVKIEKIKTSDLIEYQNNARTHSAEQVEKIALSIKEFGFVNPIGIDKKTKTVLAGHGRLMSAKKLGMEYVPTVAVDNLTELSKRAYILGDNRIAEESYWDTLLLAEEISFVSNEVDLKATGFNESIVASLMERAILPEEAIEQEDESEPTAEPRINQTVFSFGVVKFKLEVSEFERLRNVLYSEAGFSNAEVVTEIFNRLEI